MARSALAIVDDAPAAINPSAFMRRDLEFIVQPQRLLRLTFSLNGGFWSIPSGASPAAPARSWPAALAWLADSNCDGLNSMAVRTSFKYRDGEQQQIVLALVVSFLVMNNESGQGASQRGFAEQD